MKESIARDKDICTVDMTRLSCVNEERPEGRGANDQEVWPWPRDWHSQMVESYRSQTSWGREAQHSSWAGESGVGAGMPASKVL